MLCPLCNSHDFQLNETIGTNKIKREWEKTFNININGVFNKISEIELYSCNNCHLKFFVPDTTAGSSYIYSELEKFKWYYMPTKWEYDVAVKDLKNYEKILEVGCGRGRFIQMLQKNGKTEIEGIELNENAAVRAQKIGLKIKNLDLKNMTNKFGSQYDAICSFQVLEHVSNPKDFLSYICKLLKQGGKLILGLPNADSFLKYQFNILDMPPHHITRWTRDTLERVSQLFPLSLERIEFEPLATYHITPCLNAYLSNFSKYFIMKKLHHPIIVRQLSKIIALTKLNNLIKGQSLYASFIRI